VLKSFVVFVVGVVAVLGARPATAINLGFEGSLAIQIATLPLIVVAGSGSALVNGSGTAGHLTSLQLAAGAFATTQVITVTDPAVFPINGIQATVANAGGNFSGSGGAGFGGVMQLLGVAKVCLYAACGSSNNLANLSVPLNVVGQGGSVTAVGAGVNLTVYGAPWTTGTASIGTMTAMGGVSPLSNTGAPSGSVSLVTPIFITTNTFATPVIPSFAFLDLHFVPEPGTIGLVGLGIAGLVAFGKTRQH
jgi:hypothetical protein